MAKEEKNETLDQIQYHYDKVVEKAGDLVDEADKEQEVFDNRENYDSDKGDANFCDRLLDELDQIQADLEDLELVIPPNHIEDVVKQAESKIRETLESNEQLKEKVEAIESRPVDQQDTVPEAESQTTEQISEPETAEEQVTEESQASEDEAAEEQATEESQASEDEAAEEQITEEEEITEEAETKAEEQAVEPEAEVEEPQAVEESEKPQAEAATDSQPSEVANLL